MVATNKNSFWDQKSQFGCPTQLFQFILTFTNKLIEIIVSSNTKWRLLNTTSTDFKNHSPRKFCLKCTKSNFWNEKKSIDLLSAAVLDDSSKDLPSKRRLYVDQGRGQFHQCVYVQLLCVQNPKAQKAAWVDFRFLHFWDLQA